MGNRRWLVACVVLLVASLGCSLLGGESGPAEAVAPAADGEPSDGQAPSSGSTTVETDFPLPRDYDNLMQVSDTTINFQTSMSVAEVVEFYRAEFASLGYGEREIVTTITEESFSLVFDGHPGGLPIVLQGFDMGGSTNVSLRFEDV